MIKRIIIKQETKVASVTVTDPICLKGAFSDYKGMLVDYICKGDADLDLALTGCAICKLDEIHRQLFMVYILEYWNAYTMDIINGTYRFINYTSMVYQSFIEHMAN